MLNFSLHVRVVYFALSVCIVFLISGVFFQLAHASIIIDGTRVIYPAQSQEVSVRLNNKNDGPRLVQAWIDDGDEKSSPENIDVPFIILTPIFRMEANKGQVLRIRYTNSKPLPTDRESVYWLNVLEIPAKVAPGKDDNYLQFAFRTRIKVFLRPEGLAGTALAAPESLQWKYQPGSLSVTNPSAFHVSLKRISVGEKSEGGMADNVMVAPFSSVYVPLKEGSAKLSAPRVKFYPVNDYGGVQDLSGTASNSVFSNPLKQ